MIEFTHLRVLALSSLLLLTSSTEASNRHKVTGRVIARDAYIGLARMSSVTNVEILVIRVDETSRRAKAPQFLKIRYEDYADQHPLAPDLLEGKSSWQFSLRRERSCDQVVSEGLFRANRDSSELPKAGTFVLVGSTDQKDIPPTRSKISCYVLKPGDVQPLS